MLSENLSRVRSIRLRQLPLSVFAMLVALGFFWGHSPSLAAESGADAKVRLRGKLEQHDGVRRLQRPAMPHLAPAYAPGKPFASAPSHLSSAVDLGADGFTLNFKKGTPLKDDLSANASASGNTDVLSAEAENNELIIAWEAWHKRVCAAIFERWRVNGSLPGVGHARLQFTRDRHVNVIVQDVHIDPAVYQILPVGTKMSPEELEQEYGTEILESVRPLDGSPLLDFPAASKRTEVILTPAFRGTSGPANFTWKKDDYERVHQ